MAIIFIKELYCSFYHACYNGSGRSWHGV